MKENILNSTAKQLAFGTCFYNKRNPLKDFAFNDALLANGYNIFDLAKVYLHSEKLLGKWIKAKNNREELFLISKAGHHNFLHMSRINEKAIRKDVDGSLKLLHTSYLDLLMLHRDDVRVPVSTIMNIANSLYLEGKIKSFGVSNWTRDRVEAANEYATKNNLIKISAVSPYYGLAYQRKNPWINTTSISGKEYESDRKYYQDNNIVVLAYASLSGGFMSGKYKSSDEENAKAILPKILYECYGSHENFLRLKRAEEMAKEKNTTVSAIALAYLLNQNLKVIPLVSSSSIKRMIDNKKALNITLTSSELDYLEI